jgi:hypothetical protein
MQARRRLRFTGAIIAATAAALLTGGTAAHATTADCRAALGNQCGTFQGQDAHATTVYWDVRGKTAAVGAPVIGYSADSTADAATDFTKVQHVGHVNGVGLSDENTVSYSFVYTPGGHWSNLCVADLNDGSGLVLRTCNGLQWQRFFADRGAMTTTAPKQIGGTFNGDSIYSSSTTSTYALQNAASRQFVSDDSLHNPGTRPAGVDDRQLVTDAPTAFFGGNEIWTWLA